MDQLTSTEINLVLFSLGGLLITLGLFSGFLKERFWLSDPLLALLLGILLGPLVLNWVNLSHWGKPETILEQGARIAIAIQVMGVALRLPRAYPLKQWRLLSVLLGLLMPLMWLSSSLLVYWILGTSLWVALLIGAVITPTDPVISTSVVTGKIAEQNLPGRIRNAISMESAANDGLAYPFVWLSVLMLTRSPAEAWTEWLTRTLLWEVGAASLMGAGIGYLAGRLLLRAEAHQTIEKTSFLSYTLALSLAILGLVKLLGGDGILAVFVAGVSFSMVIGGQERSQEGEIQEAIDRFFTLYIFVLLGLALPWQQWLELGWKGLGLAIAVLLLRRLPGVLLLRPLLGRLGRKYDALFLGWFGPIGVAALFYAMLSLRDTGMESPWIVSSLIICISILVHGVTAVPLAELYHKAASRTLTIITNNP
ncbi:MAG: cation:proton antiporter [Leptolyngbyaceae bacterium]|nr:cation:proton antiporter [Leptolyngbyaceae bacterium]